MRSGWPCGVRWSMAVVLARRKMKTQLQLEYFAPNTLCASYWVPISGLNSGCQPDFNEKIGKDT